MKGYMKKILYGWLLLIFALTFSMHETKDVSAFRSRNNLRQFEGNLDILRDKNNRLSQLIQELQGFKVEMTTGGVVGSSFAVSGITVNDTVVGAVVMSSSNIVLASSQTGTTTNTDERLLWQARITGAAGNNIRIQYSQKSLGDPTSTQLTINNTGYNIEVKLSTGHNSAFFSSATMVVNAIRAHPAANSIVKIAEVGSGTGTVTEKSQFALVNGAGIFHGFHNIDSSAISITTNGVVQVSTSGVVDVSDVIYWLWYDRDGR